MGTRNYEQPPADAGDGAGPGRSRTGRAGADIVPIAFVGDADRVTGYVRDGLLRVRAGRSFGATAATANATAMAMATATIEALQEDAPAHAPARVELPPDQQPFAHCRRA